VVHLKTIRTHSVYARDIALVFHGTRRQQRSPRVFAGLWPVGDDEQSVVGRFSLSVERVAQPYWEAKVKADRQAKAPPAPGNDYGFGSAFKVAVLSRYRKEVALVGGSSGSVGFNPVKSVGHLAGFVRHKHRGTHGVAALGGEFR